MTNTFPMPRPRPSRTEVDEAPAPDDASGFPSRPREPRTVTVLSFRGGTGKTNLVANLGWLAARRGARVAIVDTDLRSPGVHVVLGVDPQRMTFTLTDFVAGQCSLREAALDVSADLDVAAPGRLLVIPSRVRLDALTGMAEEGHDPERLGAAMASLREDFELDLLLVDSRPGLNPQTLVTAAISDLWVVLVRDDAQDREGTRVIIEAARRIRLPDLLLVPAMVAGDAAEECAFGARLADAFGCDVGPAIPRTPELSRFGSRGLFARERPDHPLTERFARLAARLMSDRGDFG